MPFFRVRPFVWCHFGANLGEIQYGSQRTAHLGGQSGLIIFQVVRVALGHIGGTVAQDAGQFVQVTDALGKERGEEDDSKPRPEVNASNGGRVKRKLNSV
jgi:hypothetical protein